MEPLIAHLLRIKEPCGCNANISVAKIEGCFKDIQNKLFPFFATDSDKITCNWIKDFCKPPRLLKSNVKSGPGFIQEAIFSVFGSDESLIFKEIKFL